MSLKQRTKEILKKNNILFIISKNIYDFYKNISLSFFSGSNKNIFTDIYKKNKWGDNESFSGKGSNLLQTKKILEEIPKVLKKYNIKSILDIPCGDFNWMKEFDFKDLNYIGADIVEELVNTNNIKFKRENVNFIHLDLISEELPSADLIFCRDCLVHFSFKDIFKALKNIKKTNSKYLMTSNFSERDSNKDISTGNWRTLNFCKPPFNFPKPLEVIQEDCTQDQNKFTDKNLYLWELESIKFKF